MKKKSLILLFLLLLASQAQAQLDDGSRFTPSGHLIASSQNVESVYAHISELVSTSNKVTGLTSTNIINYTGWNWASNGVQSVSNEVDTLQLQATGIATSNNINFLGWNYASNTAVGASNRTDGLSTSNAVNYTGWNYASNAANNASTEAFRVSGGTNVYVSTNDQREVNLNILKVQGNAVNTNSGSSFDGGEIHLNTTLGNANPKLTLTNGYQQLFAAVSNGEGVIGFKANEVVTNVSGGTTWDDPYTNNLKLRLDFDSAIATTVDDTSLANHDGTNMGGVTRSIVGTNANACVIYAATYGGTTTGYLSFVDHADWTLGTSATFSAWVKVTSWTPVVSLFSHFDTGGAYAGWDVFDNGTDGTWDLWDGVGWKAMTGSGSTNSWKHLTVVLKATNYYSYVDGILRASGACGSIGDSTQPLLLGRRTVLDGAALTGSATGYRVYSIPLASNEVMNLYSNKGYTAGPAGDIENIATRTQGAVTNLTTNVTEYIMAKVVQSGASNTAPRLLLQNIPLGPVGSAGTLYTNASGALYVK